MCHSYSKLRLCECGFKTHSWTARKTCLKVHVKALLNRRSKEELFGMCGTIHYELATVGKDTMISVCDDCAQRNTEEQLVGRSLTQTQEHLDFVEIFRIPSECYKDGSR